MIEQKHSLFFFFFGLFLLAPSSNGGVAAGDDSGNITISVENPFTPKAHLIRYWKKQISNDLPKPSWFLNKASPMNAVQLAFFSKLADQNSLSSHLSAFCKSGNLLCFPDLSSSLDNHPDNVKFSTYSEKNFTNYGTSLPGGVDSFQSYSEATNFGVNDFHRYSRDSTGHGENFSSYAASTNIADQSFNNYGTTSTGGAGEFSSYSAETNIPNLRFTSYSDSGNGREQSFTGYNFEGNFGNQSFTSYGKNGNGGENGLNTYANDSNAMNSGFSNYGETGNAINDSFTSYGSLGNDPENIFKGYGDGGNAETLTFKNYREGANVGDDSFQSYAKKSNSEEVVFENYGQTRMPGTDKFTGYGENSTNQEVGFKLYGVDNTFKGYAEKGVSFSTYKNETSEGLAELAERAKKVINKWVEPGKFFREKMLKEGVVMPMPNIKDKMPKRSFLPRVIASKFPFSTTNVSELRKIFNAGDNSSMANMIVDSVRECERAPSRGETKHCVISAEDMIDFATSVLGHNVVVQTTENTEGSNSDIMIGSIKGINGGHVTKAVSCHQSLFPSLQYYCHSVPKVRVYVADILDPQSKSKINRGVAICHIDTSDWSSGHGAFAALGSGPGEIEVCHWIFENDMTWTISD